MYLLLLACAQFPYICNSQFICRSMAIVFCCVMYTYIVNIYTSVHCSFQVHVLCTIYIEMYQFLYKQWCCDNILNFVIPMTYNYSVSMCVCLWNIDFQYFVMKS